MEIEDEPSGITDGAALTSSINSVAQYVFTAVWAANITSVIGYPTPTTTNEPGPTSTAPEIGEVTCFPESRRPIDQYGPVNPDNYEAAVDTACQAFQKHDPKKPKPTDEMWSWLYETKDGNTPFWFNVGWDEGCTLNGTDTQEEKMEDPLGDGSHTCEKIFKDDIFWKCKFISTLRVIFSPWPIYPLTPPVLLGGNNAGRGGFIQAGCLTYVFEPCGDDGTSGCFTVGRGAPWVAT